MTIILNINGSLLCIPNNSTGVVAVCNNKFGTELSCIGPNNNDKVELNIGDSICIKLMDVGSSALTDKFIAPKFDSKKTVKDNNENYGMSLCVNNNDNICMPFMDGGAVTLVVTVNKGVVSVDAGSITADNVLLDYYRSELTVGDEISVSITKLDFVSSPMQERPYSTHKCD